MIRTTSPQSQAAAQLSDRSRELVLPTAEQGTTLDVHVGGSTATFEDFATVLIDELPLSVAVIVGRGEGAPAPPPQFPLGIPPRDRVHHLHP